jgi:hypothetical protein
MEESGKKNLNSGVGQPPHPGLKLDQNYNKWWNQRRQSPEPPRPSELLNCGVPPKAVNLMCWETLKCATRDTEDLKGPGHIDYLVRSLFFTKDGQAESFLELSSDSYYKSKTNNHYGTYDRILVHILELGPQDQVCVEDIVSLVDLYGAAFAGLSDESKKTFFFWQCVIRSCFRYEYGSEFLLKVFARIPKIDVGDGCFSLKGLHMGYMPPCRLFLDADCVLVIEQLVHVHRIPRIEIDNIISWEQSAFMKLLEVVVQASDGKSLDLFVPSKFFGVRGPTLPSDSSDRASLVGLGTSEHGQRQGFERLRLHFLYMDPEESGELAHHSKGGGIPTLQVLPNMVGMKHLDLDLQHFPFKEAAPYITRTFQNARMLESVRMSVGHPSEDIACVLNTFEALKSHPSISDFCYGQRIDQAPGQWGKKRLTKLELYNLESMHEKFLEILKEDTTLRKLSVHYLYASDDYSDPEDRHIYRHQRNPKIDFYLDLNEHGRGQARQSTIRLDTFVNLLLGTEPTEGLSDLRAFNIRYGLLMESPGVWSDSPNLVQLKTRKRKVCT